MTVALTLGNSVNVTGASNQSFIKASSIAQAVRSTAMLVAVILLCLAATATYSSIGRDAGLYLTHAHSIQLPFEVVLLSAAAAAMIHGLIGFLSRKSLYRSFFNVCVGSFVVSGILSALQI